jgi:hypothetical protein
MAMTQEFTKLIRQISASRFDYLSKANSPEERTGALGIVTLFALASHTLTTMTGTLAIVSVDHFGVNGGWHGSRLCAQVQRLAELSVQVSSSVERLVGMALVDLHALHVSGQDAVERENIEEIMTTGRIYMESLSNVSVETANLARRQGIWGRRPAMSQPSLPSAEFSPELAQAEESVRRLIGQIIELELGVEQFGGRWVMS